MKKFIAFLALLVAWLAAPPLANADTAWTVYFDISNTDWTQCRLDIGWSNDGGNNITWNVTQQVGTPLYPGSKIYKFTFEYNNAFVRVYGDDSAPATWGAGTMYGAFGHNNNGNWKLVTNRLYVLSSSDQGASSVTDDYKAVTSCDLYGYPCNTNAGTSYETFCTLSYNETSGKWEGTFTPKHTGDKGKFDLREFWSDGTTQRWRGNYGFDSSHKEYTLNQGDTWNIAINDWVGTELKATYDASTHLLHIEPAVVLPTATYSFSGGTEEANPLVVNTTTAYGFTVTCANTGGATYNIYYQTWNGSAWVDEQHPYGGTAASPTVSLPAPTEGTDVTYKIRTIIPVSADLGIPGNQIVETRYVTLHYQDPSAGWYIYAICEKQPNIWMWGSKGNLFTSPISFPGPQMTKDTTHGIDNLWYYHYDVDDKDVTGVKFSWGSSNYQFNSGTFKGGVFVLSGSYPTYASLAAYEEAVAPHWYLAYQSDNFDASKVFCELTQQGDTDVWLGNFNVDNQKEGDKGKFYVWGKVNGTYTKYDGNFWFKPTVTGPTNLSTPASSNNLTVDGYANDAGVLVTLNTGSTKTIKIAPRIPLNVYPRAVADHNNDWSYLSTTSPAVYVTGRYINNNRLVPDWEMTLNAETNKWEITGTLHTDAQLTIHYITGRDASGYPIEQIYTATPGTGNYSTNGCPVKITYNHSDNSISFEKLNNGLPPFFSLVGLGYKQRLSVATPNNYGDTNKNKSDRGWQESWILYDANQNPVYDVNGNVIYSTQWPPVEPVLFKAVSCSNSEPGAPDGQEEIEISSRDLTFVRDTRAARTLTDWKKELTDGLYYSKLFKSADGNTDYSTTTNYNDRLYVRYVIDNAWMLGATKIWSGWSSGIYEGTKGDWTNFRNIGLASAGTSTDWDGNTIDAGCSVPVEPDKGNFYFETATNLHTFELYLPVDASGNLDDTNMKYALIYTSLNRANVQIKAKPVGSSAPKKGQFCPSYESAKASGLTFVDYTVERYIYDQSYIDNPNDPSVWNKAVYNETNVVVNACTTNNIVNNTANWFIDPVDLDNGRYFYYITVNFKEGSDNVVVNATSNFFTIQNFDIKPMVTAMQLVDINQRIASDTGKVTDDANKKYAKYAGKTITYRQLGTGLYYLVDRTTGYATPIDGAEADDLIRFLVKYPMYFVWTSDFYVVGQVGTDYYTMIDNAVKNGTITSSSDYYPTIYIKKNDSSVTWTDDDKAVLTPSGNKLIGKIFRGGGSLVAPTFTTTMALSYTTTGDAGTEVTIDPGNASYTTTSDACTLQVPTPFHLQYNYSNNEHYEVNLVDDTSYGMVGQDDLGNYVTLPTISAVDGVSIDVKYYQEAGQTENWNVRRLDCDFTFYRPNVAQDIIHNYKIEYDVALGTNRDDEAPSSAFTFDDVNIENTYVDSYNGDGDTQTYRTNVCYTLTLADVHPEPFVYPYMRIKATRFVPNTASPEYGATYYTANHPYTQDPLYINAPNSLSSTMPTMGHLFLKETNLNGGDKDIMYAGHRDFNGATGTIGSAPVLDYESNHRDNVAKPYLSLYHFETYYPGTDYRSGPYFFVTHVEGHQSKQVWVDKDGVEHTNPNTTEVENGAKDSGWWLKDDPDDKLLGHIVGWDVPSSYIHPAMQTTAVFPQVKITPVAIFWRNPNTKVVTGVAEDIDLDTDYPGLEIKGAAASAPRRDAATLPDVNATSLVVVRGTTYDTGTLSPSDNPINDIGTTGIENVAYGQQDDGEVMYFTIQGIRVENPAPGQVYLVRRGNVVTKEYIK